MSKRLLLILLAIAFGCTQKIEPQDSIGGEISFSLPIVKPTTKAENLPLGIDFLVHAKYYTSNFTTWSAGFDYFGASGSRVTYSSGVLNEGANTWDAWKTSPNTYYWPRKGSLAFQAYSPFNSAEHPFHAGNSISQIDPVAPDPAPAIISESGINAKVTLGNTPGQQIDFLYSERIINQKGNQKWATSPEEYPNLYGVQIPFHHALAKITFQSMLRSHLVDPENEYYIITNISLRGVRTAGVFTQGLNNTSSNIKTEENIATWDPWVDTGEYISAPNFIGNAVQTEREIAGTQPNEEGYYNIYLIPQDITSNFELIITYKEKTPIHEEEIKTHTITNLDLASITSFDIGKNYIFTFLFGKDKKIYFEPQMKDWSDQDLSGDIHYTFK